MAKGSRYSAPSGYYASCHRTISAHEESDRKLGQEVERVFLNSRRTYGSDRVEKQLRDDGKGTRMILFTPYDL